MFVRSTNLGRDKGASYDASICGCWLPTLPLLLLRQEQLRKAGGVDVTEERCSRRQKLRLQKLVVEGVGAVWRTVYRGAALEYADRLAIHVQADQRALIVQVLAAPIFDVPKEVVNSAVRPEVLASAGRLIERKAFTRYDGCTIPGGGMRAIVHPPSS